jgi:hypothetical protein
MGRAAPGPTRSSRSTRCPGRVRNRWRSLRSGNRHAAPRWFGADSARSASRQQRPARTSQGRRHLQYNATHSSRTEMFWLHSSPLPVSRKRTSMRLRRRAVLRRRILTRRTRTGRRGRSGHTASPAVVAPPERRQSPAAANSPAEPGSRVTLNVCVCGVRATRLSRRRVPVQELDYSALSQARNQPTLGQQAADVVERVLARGLGPGRWICMARRDGDLTLDGFGQARNGPASSSKSCWLSGEPV